MPPVHLLVLIHGMWGNPDHLAELERIALETHSEPASDGARLHVLQAQTNREDSTYDGVDWGGERVAKEVQETITRLESEGDQVIRFSVTGYSLGGLIARYLIGILHQNNFFEKIEPINFNTIATPHTGLPRYPSFLSSLTSTLGPKLLSRTGEQFYCADKWSPNGRPLLVVMADPERVFYQALAKFKHIRIYANAVNDITVPYVAAAIESTDPFVEHEVNGIKLDISDKFPAIIEGYELPEVAPPRPAALSASWFKGLKPTRPLLPPFLQLRFPLNLVLYVALPLLVPVVISLLLMRLSLASRSSRARIKQLEEESHTSNHQKLADILEEIEREVEEAVVELIDNDEPMQSATASKAHPIITPNHKKIVRWLNTLPIQKEIAFFPMVRNSHALIVCRDVKRFEIHRQGEGVVRHWATSFIL